MKPRELAFTAAERLASTGLEGERLVAALRELGFPDSEARVAANALRAKADETDRSVAESRLREELDTGYASLLIASVCLGGGVLLVMLRIAALLGTLAIVLGVALLARGLWLHWRARGV